MYVMLKDGSPVLSSLDDIRRAHPQMSLPDAPAPAALAEYGIHSLHRPPPPEYDQRTHQLRSVPVQQADGTFTLQHKITRLTAANARENLRAERNRLLAECDWLALRAFETGVALPAAWRAYRQALRDLPSQAGFPFATDWPVQP